MWQSAVIYSAGSFLGVQTMPDKVTKAVSSILRPMSTDEYTAPPRTEQQQQAVDTSAESNLDSARRLTMPVRAYVEGRRGTAAGLLSVNEAAGVRYFDVPPEAALDDDAAADAFSSEGPVIDVQTHWIADRPTLKDFQSNVMGFYRMMAPDWWRGIDDVVAYDIAEYLRCVFIESETALAVISAAPGNASGEMFLKNDEMAGMRELFDRTAGTGRLLNHTVVRPNMGETDRMAEWKAAYNPVGWKVYTLGLMDETYQHYEAGAGWRLDDDETGMPFLEQARALDVKLVCAHKGVSGMVDAGSPEDVGPAAKAFPDIDFVIYHSGYEPGQTDGPFTSETAHLGVNRLVKTVQDAGLGLRSNVYAELGTTWFMLLSRPEDAAHVLGKLLLHLGEDNIIWGTDSIWYGPTQPVLDAFRAFQIPDAMCEEFGYPKISAKAKAKILSGNAARVYGIDLDDLAKAAATDDLSWTTHVAAELQ
jgi:predicted TIM-barrel fold metal-dependent hydrolase